VRGESALIAVQGPRSVEVLAPLVDADIAALKYYTCVETKAGGVEAIVARTGYTGEDGFEVFLPADAASGLWDALLAENRDRLAPCGLGARDVLRLEAGMPLYGHELTEEITPLQAGLGWAVKFAKPSFTGKAALEAQAAADDYPRIAGLVLDGRVPARARATRCCATAAWPAKFAAVRSLRPSGTRASRPRCSIRRAQPSERGWESRCGEPNIPATTVPYRSTSEGRSGTTGGTSLQQRSRVGETRRRCGDDRDQRLRAVLARRHRVRRVAALGRDAAAVRVDRRRRVGEGRVGHLHAARRRGARDQPAIEADPSLVNREPFGEGWFYKFKLGDDAEKTNLMSGPTRTTS
jgi:hypothetical protein